jgi:AmmeMemoRadiSam system protein A
MAGVFDGMAVKATALSHQDVTGVGYGICTFYPEGSDESRYFLKEHQQRIERECMEKAERSDIYVRLARAAVNDWVRYRRHIPVPEDLPEEMLEERAGAFVSIHRNGQLRGCIGTIAGVQDCVAEEIIQNAASASTGDPRFSPITEDELSTLDITVDVLEEPEDISSPEELDVKQYGVIVTCGMRRGLLLPNLDGVDRVEDQIRIACQKAGIGRNENFSLQRFKVVRHY